MRHWIFDEFDKHKGNLVIVDFNKVARIVAIGEDKWDYFYVTWNGRDAECLSPLTPVIALKDKIDDKDYNRLVDILKLNDWCLIADEKMQEECKEAITKYILQDSQNVLLTEIYLKLN